MNDISKRASLSSYKRIVVKIGSALLVDPKKGLRRDWLASLAADLAALRAGGTELIVVSSGAIALGRTILGLGMRHLKLEESQAAASVGQIALARAWSEALGVHDLASGQILVTLSDTEERRRYLNARATMNTLLKLGAVPVVNENDTVATSEIRYGDNDRLAARVAVMVNADLLVLLSDVDGLYTAPPALDSDARFIAYVNEITPDIDAMAGEAGSGLSRGGMRTKIDAGRIANAGGAAMIITAGTRPNPLAAYDKGEPATFFAARPNARSGYKAWIAGHLDPAGRMMIDAGAVTALKAGKSLLPAGVKRVDGNFMRGDTIAVTDEAGTEVARGLAAYDAEEARRIAGHRSSEIEAILGYEPRAAMIHRDDMVVM